MSERYAGRDFFPRAKNEFVSCIVNCCPDALFCLSLTRILVGPQETQGVTTPDEYDASLSVSHLPDRQRGKQ